MLDDRADSAREDAVKDPSPTQTGTSSRLVSRRTSFEILSLYSQYNDRGAVRLLVVRYDAPTVCNPSNFMAGDCVLGYRKTTLHNNMS
jgi:hypothetical protein